MAQKQSSTTNENTSFDTIQRTAIDPSGYLGSFYDGYRESLCGQLSLSDKDKLTKLFKRARCELKKGNRNQIANLLQLINMPQELRLSVLLDLVSGHGIASIIDYSNQIDECIRFLCYSYIYREEQVSDKVMKIRKMDKSSTPSASTTHIITGVNYGIDAAVVLQLPSGDNDRKQIDNVLERICTTLNDNQNPLVLNEDDENLLRMITDTTIYSNIPPLIEMSSVCDVCLYIDTNKDIATNYPIMYTLRPINWILPNYTGPGIKFISTPSAFRDKIEQYLVEFSNTIDNLKYSLDSNGTQLLNGTLDKKLNEAQQQFLRLKKSYTDTVKRLQNLVFEIRKNRSKMDSFNQTLTSIKDKMSKDTKEFTQLMKQLEEKGQLISELKKQNFTYCNAAERHVSERDNDKTLIRKLTINNRWSRIFCTSDRLNKKDPAKYNENRLKLVEERKIYHDLDIIYADFSYCGFEIGAKIISTLTSNKGKTNEKITAKKPSTRKRNSDTVSSSKEFDNEVINILLLGETGVGKSTFINAFVNYLTFETFEKAQSNEPVVLIPVSFLITTGDDFEEHIVKFGDFVTSHNEDFEHPGESVTQYCKSYEFHLNQFDGKKLCIIDTPGFGDTRGLDQDDMNMQHILEYINNLSHLNAVCFLLKPNASRLNIFFRTCLIQLLDLLGSNAHQNIIFCFTNARSTFYTPGNTAPLLRSILDSLSINDIPFKKANTFCFDNEAFRYLVALQNGIRFDEEEKHEYEMSWTTSVNESNRLIDYISTQLDVYPVHNEWKSIKHAQIEIIHMIRPMLEAMRNILRNIILCEMVSADKSIKLCPKEIYRASAICSSCTPYLLSIGNFWIVREITHEFLKNCLDCSCPTNQHIPIHYILNYEDSDSSLGYSQKEMIDMVERICLIGADFDYFLNHVAHSSKGDSFFIGLVRRIAEEDDLCKNQKPNRLNLKLYKNLIELKYQYEERIETLKSNQQQTTLTNIYKLIASIREYPMIQNQIDAIKETQKMMAEPYEISQD